MRTRDSIRAFWERHRLAIVLLYGMLYMMGFDYVERTVTTHFHVIHLPIDDFIPFCEFFIVPYLMWFAYVAFGVLYFMLHDRDEFYQLCIMLATGMSLFIIISALYPNGHFLRPYYFTRDNICIQLCKMIYSKDTATNLFPSIHVYNSLAIHLAFMKCKTLRRPALTRSISGVIASSIILSTMFVKQHSVFDVLCAFGLAFIMYQLVYSSNLVIQTHPDYRPVPARKPSKTSLQLAATKKL